MPKYVIEREIPDAGKWSAEEIKGISIKSRCVSRKPGGCGWRRSWHDVDPVTAAE